MGLNPNPALDRVINEHHRILFQQLARFVVTVFLTTGALYLAQRVDRLSVADWQQKEISFAICKIILGCCFEAFFIFLLIYVVTERQRRQRGCYCAWDGWSPRWCYKCKTGVEPV